MGKYITISEIARQLNISHSTVSRALRNHPGISKKTRNRVRDLAEQLGYQTNNGAYQLSKGKSQIIGVIVPDLSVHFYSRVVQAIQSILEKEGYSLLLFDTFESFDREVNAVNNCLKHRVDGILAAISMKTTSLDHFGKLLKHEVPLVFFDRVANFLPVPKVVTDDYQAAFKATNHLVESGCQCIAHITASINLNNSNNRLYGYLDALTSANIRVDESLIHYYELNPLTIDAFLEGTLKNHPAMNGLFVFNDYVANYAINVLKKLGKVVPNDISVIGFSDEPIATYMTPQLSTLQQVSDKMGQLTAQKMVSILKGNEPVRDEKIMINPELILRETTT